MCIKELSFYMAMQVMFQWILMREGFLCILPFNYKKTNGDSVE